MVQDEDYVELGTSGYRHYRLVTLQVKLGANSSDDRSCVFSRLRCSLSLFSQRKHFVSIFAATTSSVRPQPPAGSEAALSGTPFSAARWRPSSFEQQLLAGHSSSPITSSVPTEAPRGTEAAFPAPALELESSPECLPLWRLMTSQGRQSSVLRAPTEGRAQTCPSGSPPTVRVTVAFQIINRLILSGERTPSAKYL